MCLQDPAHTSPHTLAGGDNDPLDVIELGTRQWRTGSIVRVKLLGVLAMIDEGETDWKVIAISVEDPLASHLHDIQDVEVRGQSFGRRIARYRSASRTNSEGFNNLHADQLSRLVPDAGAPSWSPRCDSTLVQVLQNTADQHGTYPGDRFLAFVTSVFSFLSSIEVVCKSILSIPYSAFPKG